MSLNLQYNVSLKPYNSLSVPAVAGVLTVVSSIAELKAAVQLASDKSWSVLVLGEGSNTVLKSDYEGLVIVNRLLGSTVLESNDEFVRLEVAAGENWHELVESCTRKGWFGLENLALIPGAVGAAPIQNIGAYGVEVCNTLVEVEYLDLDTMVLCRLDNEACEFAYRDSVFKRELADRAVITSVGFVLSKQANCNLTYPALAERVSENSAYADPPTPFDVFNAVCEIRRAKLPLPSTIPNVGSFFKNPVISAEAHEGLLKKYPSLVSFTVSNGVKLAAGWLIETAGWKNKSLNGVCVHHDHALVIVNPEHSTGSEVIEFAAEIQKSVLLKFGITLEIEPRIY